MKKRLHAATLLLLAGVFGLAVFGHRPAPQDPAAPNPATMTLEYRPGAYFPKGFPLHGEVKLLSAPVVEMGRRERVRVEYTVGDIAIETGMAIEVWKHFTSDVEEFQVADPSEPAHFAVEFSKSGVEGATRTYTNWVQRNTPDVFPYRKTAAVTLQKGRLEKGDRVIFDLGGARGVRMQHYQENLFNFRIVLARDEKVVGYAGDAIMKVIGGPLVRLRVQAPSIVKTGEAFPVAIVPQDQWGSLAKDAENLAFRVTSGAVSGVNFQFDPELMHYVAPQAKASREGVLRIGVRTADGHFEALSNPIWVERNPARGIYFGDLHQHTYLHDGRGVYEEIYLYGRRLGLLDFGAASPHHMPMSVTGPNFHLPDGKRYPSENWPDLKRATKLMNGWKGFVSILGYEYSVGTNAGGHHNVFFNADDAKSTMELDPADPAAPIGKMLKTLQLVQKPTLVIPHIGGGPPDWSHPTDPRIERLFEIASVHGVFEESYQMHLKSGLRLAASAAGDTHTTAMGNAYPGLIYTMTNALTGVYAAGKSRQAIWDGMYDRRTFGVTGNTRMLLDFSVNGEPMGGEVAGDLGRPARIAARISATAPIIRAELLKNATVIHAVHPARKAGRFMRVVWGDNVYQRRANVGLRKGELRAERGSLRLVRPLHLDQAFETVDQTGDRIAWTTAAVSGDRDGFLADISTAGDALHFRLDDSDTMGLFEVRIPLDQLRQNRHFAFSRRGDASVKHPYMERMGVEPTFFLECEMVDPEAPLDLNFNYQDRRPVKSGDYYYLRVEQLDTNKAWSSPVWMQ